jgi:hypothetical protein
LLFITAGRAAEWRCSVAAQSSINLSIQLHAEIIFERGQWIVLSCVIVLAPLRSPVLVSNVAGSIKAFNI